MLSETLPSSRSFPPQDHTTAFSSIKVPPQQEANTTKHPLMQHHDDASSMPPPPKRVKTATATAKATTTTNATAQYHRIPCKARGMSKKHNSDTAFLDIPVDAPHGLLLSCSHFECSSSGRRFRYCTVCESPVAKRNFPKRHGHGLIKSAKDLKKVDYTCGFINSSAANSTASCLPCGENNEAAAVDHAAPLLVAAPSFRKSPRHRRVVSHDTAMMAQGMVALASQPAAAHVLTATQNEWINLLHRRPKLEQATNMANWMEKIINFSEGKGKRRALTTSNMPRVTPQMTLPQQPVPQMTLSQEKDDSGVVTPPRSLSPSDPALVVAKTAKAAPVVGKIMQNLKREARQVSEFASAMDNVDMTTIFD